MKQSKTIGKGKENNIYYVVKDDLHTFEEIRNATVPIVKVKVLK